MASLSLVLLGIFTITSDAYWDEDKAASTVLLENISPDRNRNDVRMFKRIPRFERSSNISVVKTSLEDGSPFLWEHKGSKVLMCLQQKCGSSAWKHVVKKQIADEANSTVHYSPGDIHKMMKTYYIENVKSDADNQLRNGEDPLRLVITREPLRRFISAYMDKIGRFCDKNIAEALGRTDRYKVKKCLRSLKTYAGITDWDAKEDLTLSKFMEIFLKKMSSGVQLEGGGVAHFTPQTTHCQIRQGLSYDYHLKVEEINLWYQDLVQLMGLEDIVSYGWEHFSGYPCFFKIKTRKCDEMLSRKPLPANAEMETHDYHPTNANSYHIPDIPLYLLNKFQRLYEKDYKIFNYKVSDDSMKDYASYACVSELHALLKLQ